MTWSGGPVDLTTAGDYTLTATVSNDPPTTGNPCDCCCLPFPQVYPPWVVDSSVNVDVVVKVRTGAWVQRIETASGTLDTPPPLITYFPLLPTTGPTSLQGMFLTPIMANIRTKFTNFWDGDWFQYRAQSATVNVDGETPSRKSFIWRWEDEDGEISPCPAEVRTFFYVIQLKGEARTTGDANNGTPSSGSASSTATASGTISLPKGDNPFHDVNPASLSITANGSASEGGGFTWSISIMDTGIGGDSGSEDHYDSTALSDIRIFTGRADGGGNTKTVQCDVRFTGTSHSEVGTGGNSAEAYAKVHIQGIATFE